jgi:hypothetical protein
MSRFTSLCVTAGLICAGAALWPALAADGSAEDITVRHFPTYWLQDRTAQDDFLSPPSGYGPVVAELGHPYVPNGAGKQQTSRIADLANPILKPWVIEQMAKPNADVRAGKVPFIARERCWPTGVPGFLIFAHAAGMYVVQTEKEILIIQELDQQTRHIYMNVGHSKNPKPSWYGESVGHFEGDELVVDTIGMNAKSFVDNYRTPHTDQIHVVEHFKIIEGGRTLQVTATVDDPGAYNMLWSAVQRWKRGPTRDILEQICAENSESFYDYDVVPIPRAAKPDF